MQQDWAYLEFDVTGLPQRPTATVLYLWPDAVTPNGDIIWPATINAKWLPDTLATGNSPLATRFSSSVPGPLANQWWGLDITKPYTGWKTGANYGLRLEASNSERLPAIFRSSRDAGVGGRPILAFSYNQPTGMPDFKMPLPGGYSWIVTEEIGGYDCMGTIPWPDTFHQNANYSLSILLQRTRKMAEERIQGQTCLFSLQQPGKSWTSGVALLTQEATILLLIMVTGTKQGIYI